MVAGEMLELGRRARRCTGSAGSVWPERGVDVVVGVRGLAAALVEGAAAGRMRFLWQRQRRPVRG